MEENAPPPSNTPPPVQPPPMLAPPSSPQPRRRGRGWMVVAFVLFVLLAISMLYNVGNFASNLFRGRSVKYTRTVGPRLEEVIYEDNESGNKIALIEVEGVITGRVLDQGGYNLVDLIKAQ